MDRRSVLLGALRGSEDRVGAIVDLGGADFERTGDLDDVGPAWVALAALDANSPAWTGSP
jgi:hypothetical protein